MKAEEDVWVELEHVEVSMIDNFEFLLELRYKLEKIWDNQINKDKNRDNIMERWAELMATVMDKCTARVRVRDAHIDDVKATKIKKKQK